MNENDSEKICGLLVEMGYDIEPPQTPGKFGNPAPLGGAWYQNKGEPNTPTHVPTQSTTQSAGRIPDLIILNTCCVRENAESRFFGILGALKKYKADDPARVLAVCGCMMQEESAVAKIIDKYKYVDFVFGTKSISSLPDLLYGAYAKQTAGEKYGAVTVMNDLSSKMPEDGLPMYRKAPPAALVSIMSGCDNFCSYCIVPYVRGREQSRQPESVVKETEKLASDGYREITLLGQNVNSYGKGLGQDGCDFAGLLERVSGVPGIWRVRFMTSHPKDLSDGLIGAMRDIRQVCPHLHLPVQSGSTQVLGRMNRGYTREEYLKVVRKIRQAIPDIALTTDVIVGFPGESESDFDDTLNLVAEAEFDLAYTFIYSPRKGTAAAKYTDIVPGAVIKDRFDRLLTLQNGISLQKNRALIGSAAEVLCEGASKTNAERLTGRTPGGKVVNFSFNNGANNLDLSVATGKLYSVRITDAHTWSLDGEAVR